MNRQLVKFSINLDMIDMKRVIRGKKGNYVDCTLFLNEGVDQYGNHGFITQSVTKEERESGVRGPILGNAKIPQKNAAPAQYPASQPVNNPYPTTDAAPRKPKAVALPPVTTVDPEDLPF